MDIHNLPEELQRKTFETFQREWTVQTSGFRVIKAGKSTALTHQVSVYRRLDDALLAVGNLPGAIPACQSGCNYCCHYHVYVSAPEALAIAEHLHATPVDKRELYLNRLKANAEQAEKLGMALHIKTNIRCAFLAEDGDCSIYALRPIACRRHHSYDVSPCRTTFEDPDCTDQTLQSPEHLATASGFLTASTAAAKHAGLDHAMYEMSGAVLEAMTNSASGKRWKAGKTSFPSVSDRDDMTG